MFAMRGVDTLAATGMDCTCARDYTSHFLRHKEGDHCVLFLVVLIELNCVLLPLLSGRHPHRRLCVLCHWLFQEPKNNRVYLYE
jgi:hypothetical protein